MTFIELASALKAIRTDEYCLYTILPPDNFIITYLHFCYVERMAKEVSTMLIRILNLKNQI